MTFAKSGNSKLRCDGHIFARLLIDKLSKQVEYFLKRAERETVDKISIASKNTLDPRRNYYK